VTFDPPCRSKDGRGTIVAGAVSSRARSVLPAATRTPLSSCRSRTGGFPECSRVAPEVTRDGWVIWGFDSAINLYAGACDDAEGVCGLPRGHRRLGFSLAVLMPTGQYDSTKFINISTHRWTFRLEIGCFAAGGPVTFEAIWAWCSITDNTNYVNGGIKDRRRSSRFMGTSSIRCARATGVAFDGNFWHGAAVRP
jgi:hypothetical protein